MDTQKRRVIYVTDEEWEAFRKAAAEVHVTISAFLRQQAAAMSATSKELAALRERAADSHVETWPTVAQFNSRGSRPVPKK